MNRRKKPKGAATANQRRYPADSEMAYLEKVCLGNELGEGLMRETWNQTSDLLGFLRENDCHFDLAPCILLAAAARLCAISKDATAASAWKWLIATPNKRVFLAMFELQRLMQASPESQAVPVATDWLCGQCNTVVYDRDGVTSCPQCGAPRYVANAACNSEGPTS